MHTPKGTHNALPIKRRIRKAVGSAFITICSISCVCTNQHIIAQSTEETPFAYWNQAIPASSGQASLIHPRTGSWIVSGINQSFGLKELNEPWVFVGVSKSNISLAFRVKSLGWESMRQWDLSGSTNYITSGFSVSLGSDVHLLRLKQPYVNDLAWSIHSRLEKNIRDDLFATIDAQNIFGNGWQVGGDPLERSLRFHVNLIVHDDVLLMGGLGISDHYMADYSSAIYWSPTENVSAYFGIGTEPSRVEMGLKIQSGVWAAGSSVGKITHSAIGWRKSYWFGRFAS